MVEALVVGIVTGGIYGLFALGLVLVFKGSGAVNFAQAEIGTLTLFVCQHLVAEEGMPYLPAALLAVAAGAAIAVVFERLAVWPLRAASPVVLTITTVALLAFLTASEITLFGGTPRVLESPLSHGISIGGVVVSGMQLLSLLLVAITGTGLAVFLRTTDFGLAVVAAADDQEAVRFLGIPLARVSMFVWGLAGALSALAALLILPTIGVLSPSTFSVIFVKALAAALIGGLSNMRGAFLGGVLVGVVEAQIRYFALGSAFIGLPELAIFVTGTVVLLARPRGLFTAPAR
jgi:branched-chain amino acid transport system permease protein